MHLIPIPIFQMQPALYLISVIKVDGLVRNVIGRIGLLRIPVNVDMKNYKLMLFDPARETLRDLSYGFSQ